MKNDLKRVKMDDPFLLQYQSSELRIASEFLNTWLPFLCRDLCGDCTKKISDRIRSLETELDCVEPGSENLDENKASSSANNVESENMNDNCDTNSLGSWKDAAETNSLASWKDGTNGGSEPDQEASTSGRLAFESPSVETPNTRLSWADMAQEDDELEEEAEQHESIKQIDDSNVSMGDLRISKVVEKPLLSRDQREHIRFKNVRRKKDFICLEKIKGKIVNILEGLELHAGVFSAAEQKRIVDYIYKLQEMGKKGELKGRTFSAPQKWMRGKGRVTIQFGCCYNYATDKSGNPPGILQNKLVEPIPRLFKVIIRRLIGWHVVPPWCVPDSCIVNIYEEGDCIPPHIDNHDFLRPFCTVSFLSECSIVFGSNLKVVGAGEFAGSIGIPLPVGSVLVLNGNSADVAKHCVPAVPTKRISITFRRMDESKRPAGFVPEPDLQGIEPLPYEVDNTKMSISDDHVKKPQVRRGAKTEAMLFAERSDTRSQSHYTPRFRRGPASKQRTRGNLGS
ncbi:oxidoreductase, 2OG-Fe(II) oxygenase family protein [Melia azedarach]|uniref:Oxidoreductase, 2OG-Fe(II) oxygenase family protein n=1 Tax=Melia azedarach TaxID=155640 RepID=A0ACC1XTH3_MELAZ|nr:oxidoreductase, 2OG-Fe(II) oxygenase family protein [Melia azedarach]